MIRICVCSLLFLSCQNSGLNNIESNESWESTSLCDFTEIIFVEGHIEVLDRYLYKETGTYQIVKNKLTIVTSDTIHTIYTSISPDTIQLFNSITYCRTTFGTISRIEQYKLTGINTEYKLADLQLLKTPHFQWIPIHMYKSVHGSLNIRCEDRKASFEDIPIFLAPSHKSVLPLIFIGEGIGLQDLKKMHAALALSPNSVTIVLNKIGHEYHFLRYRPYVKISDLSSYVDESDIDSPSLIPPVYPEIYDDDLVYFINSKNDIPGIELLTNSQVNIFSINSNLDLADFVTIEQKLDGLARKLNFSPMVLLN